MNDMNMYLLYNKQINTIYYNAIIKLYVPPTCASCIIILTLVVSSSLLKKRSTTSI